MATTLPVHRPIRSSRGMNFDSAGSTSHSIGSAGSCRRGYRELKETFSTACNAQPGKLTAAGAAAAAGPPEGGTTSMAAVGSTITIGPRHIRGEQSG